MRCTICGCDIQPGEPRVAANSGVLVHLACAEREAAQAWRQRRRWALGHATLIASVVFVCWRMGGACDWLLALTGGWVAVHAILHRRWWYYLRRDACAFLRGHRSRRVAP